MSNGSFYYPSWIKEKREPKNQKPNNLDKWKLLFDSEAGKDKKSHLQK